MLTTGIHELDVVVASLKAGKTPEPTTIRTFLSWFDIQRRTSLNVKYIEEKLDKAGVRTVPSYLNRWVESPIAFERITGEQDAKSPKQDTATNSDTTSEDGAVSDDPSFRIGNVKSAQRVPTSVKPNATLQEAMTLMLTRGFSQIPIMSNERTVKGIISWTSIGSRLAANGKGEDVQSYKKNALIINSSESLFTAVKIIAEHDYVLIRSTDDRISGIVTASDIALQFEEISKPFLLIAEIENQLRALISKKIKVSDIKETCAEQFLPKNFSQIHQLSFGNYVNILQNEKNWNKLGLNIERITFCAELERINRIRNEVMHFNPDPRDPADISALHDISRMLEILRSVGAF